MVRVMLAALAAALVSLSGGAALAHHKADHPKDKDKHYQKEQCKDGGWQAQGFKNQGECVSYYASGGRSGGPQGEPN